MRTYGRFFYLLTFPLIMNCFMHISRRNAYSYPWPTGTGYQQQQINSTLGEIRDPISNPRFHEGVDINASNGTSVYAVESGFIPWFGGMGSNFIIVGYFGYFHVSPDSWWLPGDYVYADEYLGYVSELNHVHFEENSGGSNPLGSFGLYGFQDISPPTVVNVSLSQNKEPTSALQNPVPFPSHPTFGIPVASGLLDIVGTANDFRVSAAGGNAGGKTAPWQIQFSILNADGSTAYPGAIGTTFNSVAAMNPAKVYVGGSQCCATVNFIYWANHDPLFGGNFDTATLIDGEYKAKVTVKDIKGGAASKDTPFIINNDGPFPIDRFPAPNQFLKNATLPTLNLFIIWEDLGAGLTPIDLSYYTLKLDGTPLSFTTGVGASVKISATTTVGEGPHTIEASAKDLGGLVTTETWSFTVDTTPPNGTIDSIANPDTGSTQFTNDQTVDVRVIGTDNTGISEVLLSNDDVSFQSFSIDPTVTALDQVFSFTLPLGDGTKTVFAKFRDKAGNESSPSTSASIILDQTQPAISAQTPTPFSFTTDSSPIISAGYSDALSGIDTDSVSLHFDSNTFISANGLAVGTDSMSFTPVSDLFDGGHFADLTVKDKAGNTAPFGFWTFNVDTQGPYVISAIATPDPAKAGAVSIGMTLADAIVGTINNAVTPVVKFTTALGQQKTLTQTSFVGGAWQGTGTISAGDDGTATIQVSAAQDGLGNVMTPNNNAGSFLIDTTAPGFPQEIAVDNEPPGYPSPWKNSTAYDVSLKNPADLSGIAGVRIKFDGAMPVSNAEGDFFALADPAAGAINTVVYSTPALQTGTNNIWLWLEDKAGNADPAQNGQATLRFDDEVPISTAASPSTASAGPIAVDFYSQDQPVLSGVSETLLWFRTNAQDDDCNQIFGNWQQVPPGIPGGGATQSTGTFVFDPQSGDANYCFYTQAKDDAGNPEPDPDIATLTKTQTLFDQTAPVITSTAVPLTTFDFIEVRWTTNEQTTGLVEYGTTTAFGHQTQTVLSKSHSALLQCGLLSPATIFFRIAATNRTGLSSTSGMLSAVTPPRVNIPTDLFGVVDLSEPITVTISNPDLSQTAFTIDGQAGASSISTTTPLEIFVDGAAIGSGAQTFNLTLNGFTFQSDFIVDTATRTVRLVRFDVPTGSTMSLSGSSEVDYNSGQVAQSTMSTPGSRIFLGYYAGIDPVPPGAVTDLSAATGLGPGEINLSWSAPGDDAYAGFAMEYDLRVATFPLTEDKFDAAARVAISTFPEPAGTLQKALASGLATGTTFFFALKTIDELVNISSISTIAVARTFDVAQSTDLIAGQPVVELFSNVTGVEISIVDLGVSTPAVALATDAASAQGLIFASNIYDVLSPDPSLPGGATIQFRYDVSGLTPEQETALRIFKFEPPPVNQCLDANEKRPTSANQKWASHVGMIQRRIYGSCGLLRTCGAGADVGSPSFGSRRFVPLVMLMVRHF